MHYVSIRVHHIRLTFLLWDYVVDGSAYMTIYITSLTRSCKKGGGETRCRQQCSREQTVSYCQDRPRHGVIYILYSFTNCLRCIMSTSQMHNIELIVLQCQHWLNYLRTKVSAMENKTGTSRLIR